MFALSIFVVDGCYAVTCLPENLVAIGDDSTHATNSDHWLAGMRAEGLQFPPRHPKIVLFDVQTDRYSDEMSFRFLLNPPLKRKLKKAGPGYKKILPW